MAETFDHRRNMNTHFDLHAKTVPSTLLMSHSDFLMSTLNVSHFGTNGEQRTKNKLIKRKTLENVIDAKRDRLRNEQFSSLQNRSHKIKYKLSMFSFYLQRKKINYIKYTLKRLNFDKTSTFDFNIKMIQKPVSNLHTKKLHHNKV